MPADCLFCRIANRQAAAHIVHEEEDVVAFLDDFPIRPGHVQVLPRRHFRYFDDLPPELAARIVAVGQAFARILKTLYEVERVAFLFTGGDVPHAHAHVVPMHEGTDITSRLYIAERELTFLPRPRAEDADLAAIADRLRSGMRSG